MACYHGRKEAQLGMRNELRKLNGMEIWSLGVYTRCYVGTGKIQNPIDERIGINLDDLE
jgi:hypothetical protein